VQELVATAAAEPSNCRQIGGHGCRRTEQLSAVLLELACHVAFADAFSPQHLFHSANVVLADGRRGERDDPLGLHRR
jgi:hypothetical protein